jgi:hypothetical protein
MDHKKGESQLSYIYNLCSSEEGHFGIAHTYHIKYDLPPHKFHYFTQAPNQLNKNPSNIRILMV